MIVIGNNNSLFLTAVELVDVVVVDVADVVAVG